MYIYIYIFYIYIYIGTEFLDGNRGHQVETDRPSPRFRRLSNGVTLIQTWISYRMPSEVLRLIYFISAMHQGSIMIGLSDVNNGMCCMTCYFLIINFCTDTRAARFDFHKVYVIYVCTITTQNITCAWLYYRFA